jgi:hypothetical protein
MIKKKIKAASYKKGGADLESLFSEWDKDNSKTLDYQELAQAITKLLPKDQMLSRTEMMQLCKKFDVDNDGHIDVFEFKEFLKISYVSKRKKRSELESNVFVSQQQLINSTAGGFRGKATKKKIKKVKKAKVKKAQWRKERTKSEDIDEGGGGEGDAEGDGDDDDQKSTEQSGNEDGEQVQARNRERKGTWSGKMTRRPSTTTIELEKALQLIPQKRIEEPQSVYQGEQTDGNWFVDSDSEDDKICIQGEMTMPKNTAPRLTPLVRNRQNARKTTTMQMQHYSTSWNEPSMSSATNVQATHARDDKSDWFSETETGAQHLLDVEGGGGKGGDIDVTLYRRQWDDRQPGDGSEANPWRVAVKTEWTGEIAAPSWPTKEGTWVYVPNPPKKYELSHHELSLKRTFGRGLETGAVAPVAANESPRQKRLKKKNKGKGRQKEIVHQPTKVVYHAMDRLDMGNARGPRQPWNTEQEMAVPDRPPTHDPNWEYTLQNEPIQQQQVQRPRQQHSTTI